MNMISTGAFQTEMDASNKPESLVSKLVSAWEKKNAGVARAGGVSLMALSLAACGSDDSSTSSSSTDTTTTTTTTASNMSLTFKVDTVDSLVGDTGDDTATGDSGSMSGADSFNGGAGADTLRVFADAATAEMINTTAVETIEVTATAAGDINLTNASGYTTLVDNGSTATYDFDSVATLPTQFTVKNITIGGQGVDFQLTAASIAGTDTFNLALENISATKTINTTTAATAGSIETLAITSTATTATATVTLANALLSAPVTTINAADGTLALGGSLVGASVDASASAGGVSMVIGAATSTITGGAGNDTIDMGANLTAADTIVGGDGTDTLSVDSVDSTLGTEPGAINVSGVETLDLDSSSASDAIDFDVFANPAEITAVTMTTAADAADITLTDTQASTFTIGNTQGTTSDAMDDLVIDLKDFSSGSDAVTLNIKNNDNAGTFAIDDITTTGIETITIATSRGTGDFDQITVNDLDGTYVTLNISGTTDLTFTNAMENSMKTVNAGDFAGNLVMVAGTGGDTITSGSGADTITGAAGADTISTGAGNDTIKGEDGADDITTGSGDDVIQLDDVDASDRIRDFETGNNADEIEIGLAAIAADTGTLVLSDSADGDQAAADAIVFHSMANGTTSAAAAIADTANTIFITNTTGINAESDVNFSMTLDGAADAKDALLAIYYDADDAQAVVGLYTLTASTAVSGANTFTELCTMDMTATEYSAITVDNFDFI